VLALAFSCSRKPQTGEQPNRTALKIGYFGDLTGPTYNFGQSALNGVLMAASQINQYGGINNRQIDIVYHDDRGSAEEAARLAGKLIDQDKVVAVIAGGVSGNSRAAAPKALHDVTIPGSHSPIRFWPAWFNGTLR
jgi:branched-chain amino acid transport system substrate-binding protein